MQTLIDDLTTLRLEVMASGLDAELARESRSREAIIAVMTRLASAELAARQERKVAYRIKEARLGRIETVDTFNFDFSHSLSCTVNERLGSNTRCCVMLIRTEWKGLPVR